MRSPSWRRTARRREEAFAGDIIGLHNHGTINIGDTFTEGEKLMFTGIPNFAPEMFRRAVLKDPLKMKALAKGLSQLCEEGATQLFKPLRNNDQILGAVGQLQFEVVAFRLQDEYSVHCVFDNVNVYTARWVRASDERKLEEFRTKAYDNLALDHSGALVYLAPSRVNLQLTLERWPDMRFQRDARAPARRERSVLLRRPVDRLGAVRLGELRVRHHGDGGLLPAVLQAVLECGRAGHREHVPARPRQRHREPGRRAARAAHRRDRGQGRRAHPAAGAVHRARRGDDRGAVSGREGRLDGSRRCCTSPRRSDSGAATSSTTRCSPTWPRRRTTTSSRATATRSGYLGGGLLFLVNVLMVTKPAMFGIADALGRRAAVVPDRGRLVGGVHGAGGAVREGEHGRPRRCRSLPAIGAGVRELANTIRHLRGDRTLLWFLLAYWFYIDGVNTIIKMAVDYGLSLGLEQSALIKALLLVQFVGFPAALAFGWLGKRIGPRAGIFIAHRRVHGRGGLRVLPGFGARVLRARHRDRAGAGRRAVAVALAVRAARAGRASRASSSASTT